SDDVLFSYTYNAKGAAQQPIVAADGSFCLFPLRVPIEVAKGKPNFSQILLTVSIHSKPGKAEIALGELCDVDDFDAPNVLASLEDDPYFTSTNLPIHRLPNPHHRQIAPAQPPPPRIARRVVSVEPTLKVHVNAATTAPETLILAVGLENNIKEDVAFDIASLDVDMNNAVVSRCEDGANHDGLRFPALLKTVDEMHILYNVTLLDTYPSDHPTPTGARPDIHHRSTLPSRTPSINSLAPGTTTSTFASLSNLAFHKRKRVLNISVRGVAKMEGLRGQVISSEWVCELEVGSGVNARCVGVVARHGRRHDKTARERKAEEA
ncbi:hypothetical protein HK104_007804, partial [Borealophlyctis nickersoniae]